MNSAEINTGYRQWLVAGSGIEVLGNILIPVILETSSVPEHVESLL